MVVHWLELIGYAYYCVCVHTLGEGLYPRWAIGKVQSKYIKSNQEDNSNNNSNQVGSPAQGTHSPSGNTEGRPPRKNPSIGHTVIPYTQGLGETFKKIYGKYGIHTHFKGNMSIRQLLVKPKDQDPKEKSGVIYSYQCGKIACNEEYIRETSRNLEERYREHLMEPSTIHVHSHTIQSQLYTGQLQHPREGGPGPNQDHKGNHLHQGKQSHSYQEYW